MKYYVVITPFFPTQDSFRGSFIFDQVKAIERNSDYRVLVFKPKSPFSSEADYEYHGVRVFLFKDLQMPSYILNGLTNNLNDLSFLRKMKSVGVDLDQIAVAHGHTARFASFALRLKKSNPAIRTVVQHHDLDPLNIRNGKWSDKRWNTRYRARKSIDLFNRIDCHVCVSNYVQENLIAFPKHRRNEKFPSYTAILQNVSDFPPLQIKKSIVLYNGVDTSVFYPQALEHPYFHIGCIGNFVDLKDQITLIKAFERLVSRGFDQMRLSLLGEGPLKQTCMKYVLDNGLADRVSFPEEVAHDRLPDYFRSLNLFVLPSYFEGFGCVYTEASACGVPFMACRHQGAAEYIPPEESEKWLFEPHDDCQLAQLIARFYQERYSQTLRFSFDINELIRDYLNQIENLHYE